MMTRTQTVAEDLATLEMLRGALEREAGTEPHSALRDAIAYLINRAIHDDKASIRDTGPWSWP